jgi:hypothetical protein
MALEEHLASKTLRGLRASKGGGEEAVMRGILRRLAIDRYTLIKRERPDFLLSIPLRDPTRPAN